MLKIVRKTLLVALVIASALVFCCSAAFADDTMSVFVNGRKVRFGSEPIVKDGVTLVEARPFAEALNASVKWSANTQSVKLTTSKLGLVLKMDYDIMTVSEINNSDDDDMRQVQLAAAPVLVDDTAFVPVRNISEALGADISWDTGSNSINISLNGYKYSNKANASPASPNILPDSFRGSGGHTFYFQNQADWQFPSYGSGYCWTCCYAMLISDVTGDTVTPADVAAVNEAAGGDGNYCYHWDITDAFGVKLVPALSKDSPYYGGMDSNSGGTRVNNPDNDDEIAAAAIKEALDNHPEGVIVRYSSYPHSIVAVGYSGDTIYFNDPMPSGQGKYSDTSAYSNITFEETCVSSKLNLADLTCIQAIEAE